jgi:hypothetical protein
MVALSRFSDQTKNFGLVGESPVWAWILIEAVVTVGPAVMGALEGLAVMEASGGLTLGNPGARVGMVVVGVACLPLPLASLPIKSGNKS